MDVRATSMTCHLGRTRLPNRVSQRIASREDRCHIDLKGDVQANNVADMDRFSVSRCLTAKPCLLLSNSWLTDVRKTPGCMTEWKISVLTVLLVNEARAMRVAEIMNDFQNLQHLIATSQAPTPPDGYNQEGYEVLRQCRAEAQIVLAAPFPPENLHVPASPGEAEKRQLQRYVCGVQQKPQGSKDLRLTLQSNRIIVDASARRFQAQKIYLRALAAIRWATERNRILGGRRPNAGHLTALRALDASLTRVSQTSEFVLNFELTSCRS